MSNRVFSVLERIVWFKSMPEMITVDNGPEFIGKPLLSGRIVTE
jgi:putative transposase